MGKQFEKKLADKLENIADQLRSVALELRGESEIVPRSAIERFKLFAESGLCLHCGKPLGDEPVKRGLHANCYSSLMQRINRGQGTERQFIHEGRMQPAGKGGRKAVPLPPLPEVDAVIGRTVMEGLEALQAEEKAAKAKKTVKATKK